ncbi:hypothetical protein OSTOST_20921 [Ostertagia ostertagi]
MEDSWVTSASSAGRRIAFFGDDTWLRLFPNAFVEAEGHSLGGQSPEIRRKLKEMDDIARRIFDVVSAQSPLLLVAVGDHGMTNAGSHGGGSEAETRVPMVFVHSKASITQPGDVNGAFLPEESTSSISN